jgi:pyruvate/2-oxoglutarate dehydrogenase complex dihydrolipoamide acyltransferase (E2) component
MALEGVRGRKVTPLARRIAQAHGLDLAAVAGTGPGGRVRAADVRALVAPPVQQRLQPPALPLARASALPVATATVELDAGPMLAAAASARAAPGRARLAVSVAAVVAAAVAGLLPAHPELNGAYRDGAALLRRRVHLAVGEASPTGLRWSVVPDAGDLTARGVARSLADADDLTARGLADAGETVCGATFAVVCLAEGVCWQLAEPPLPGTAATLSVGAPARRAVAIGEAVAVRSVATLTLSYDARLIDHSSAVGFLTALRGRLEEAAAPE